VIILRYFSDANIQEIAAGLRIEEGAVRALLFRARRALAAGLGEEEQEGGGSDAAG
jgi:DNA-directed RNA polymerase specialized sigma24 family protein